MCQLFATLMVFQTPSGIRTLFEEFKDAMCDDYIRHDQLNDPNITLQERHIHLCLWDINTCLRVHGKSVSDIELSDLPQLPDNFIHPQNQIQEINIAHEREQGEQMLQQLITTISGRFMTPLSMQSQQILIRIVILWMDQQVQVKPFCTTLLFTTYRH